MKYILPIPAVILCVLAQGVGCPALADPVPEAVPTRPLSADRPDATESPYTVEPGRVQLELSLVDLSWDKAGSDRRTRTVSIAPTLVKVGLTRAIDLQIGVDPYTFERSRDRETDVRESAAGFGDLVVRTKFNLWGNDAGDTAFGLMPYIKFPTADDGLGNDRVEGGLIAPLAIDLPETLAGGGWGLGLMAEWDLVYDEEDQDHRSDLVHTIVLGRDIGECAGVFVEFAGAARLDGGEDYRGSINLGTTYALSPDAQIDAGVRIGLTPAAEDLGLFLGLTLRF